jgi:hypothetical protein
VSPSSDVLRRKLLTIEQAETADRLAGLAGFRNILVREYATVRLDRVALAMERLDDFLSDVEKWLERSHVGARSSQASRRLALPPRPNSQARRFPRQPVGITAPTRRVTAHTRRVTAAKRRVSAAT